MQFSSVDFVVSAESSVKMMYDTNVGLIATNLSMRNMVRLIHVHALSSRHIHIDH